MKTHFKKAMSIFLSVLMVLSCWVWVVPEDAHIHANAATPSYKWKVTLNVSGDGTKHTKASNITIYWKNKNGTGDTDSYTLYSAGAEGDIWKNTGDYTYSSDSFSDVVPAGAFPYKATAYVKSGSQIGSSKLNWKVKVEVLDQDGKLLYDFGWGNEEKHTISWGTNNDENTSTHEISSDKYPYVLNISTSPDSVIIGADGNAVTNNVTLSAVDQYGVDWVNAPKSVTALGSAKVNSVSGAKANITCSNAVADYNAVSATYACAARDYSVSGVPVKVTRQISFDNYFDYNAWRRAGITGMNVAVSDVTATGFKVTSTRTTDGSDDYTYFNYILPLAPGDYTFLADATAPGGTYSVLVAWYKTGTVYESIDALWPNMVGNVAPKFNNTETKPTFDFTVPEGSAFISVRVDPPTNASVRLDNFRIIKRNYPIDEIELNPITMNISYADKFKAYNGKVPIPTRDGYHFMGWEWQGNDFYDAKGNWVLAGNPDYDVKTYSDELGYNVVLDSTWEAHTYVWIDEVSATCTGTGIKGHYECTGCDMYFDSDKNVISDVSIPALGHKAGAAATCTAPQKCTVCQAVLVEALGHKAGAAATCTAPQKCTVCQAVLVEALGHKAGAAATCTAPQKCTVCQAVLVEALGHDEIAHEAKAPTCTEFGWDAYVTCSRCDYTTYEEKEALKHDMGEFVETKAPSCTEKGESRSDCSRCDYFETKEIDSLGHNEVSHEAQAPTCTEIGWDAYVTCSRCDYTTKVEKAANGHKYDLTKGTDNENGTHTVSCTVCAEGTEGHTSVVDCTFDVGVVTVPTCTTAGYTTYTCTVCKYFYTDNHEEATGHDWDEVKTEDNLTRPDLVDGVWVDGKYTFTCKNDPSHTKEVPVERADYSDYEEIVKLLNDLLSTDITEDAKQAINEALAKNDLADNLIGSEQAVVTAATSNLERVFEENKGALKTYTVTFKANGETVKIEKVISGNNATAPADPTKDYDDDYHYAFSNWDNVYTNVTENITVTAVFTATEHNYTTHTDKDDTYHTDKCACGYEKDVEHSFNDGVVTTEPTCSAKGEKLYTCSICNGTKTEKMNEVEDAHKWKTEYTVDSKASCEKAGQKSYHCEYCNVINTASIVVIAKRTHNIVDTTEAKEATCIETGIMNQKCNHTGSDEYEACTYTTTRVIEKDADNHTGAEELVNAKNATCTEDGYTGDMQWSCCKVVTKEGSTIGKLGHKYDLTKGTDNKNGTHTVTCTECAEGTEGHTDVVDCTYGEGVVTAPTCTKNGFTTHTCTVCSYSYTDSETTATGHTFGAWTAIGGDKHERTCTVCADENGRVETADCTYGAWTETVAPTCTEKGEKAHTCTVCKNTVTAEVDALGHEYGDADCTKPATCTRCGDTTGTALGHSFTSYVSNGNATCLEDGTETAKCDRCDAEDTRTEAGSAIGHDWSVTYNFAEDGKTCTATRVCANDTDHNVTVNATITSEVTNEPTCTEKGTTTYTATFDAEWAITQTKDVVDVPAKDHAWSVTYNFASDGKTCTATRVCANDTDHNVTVNATITSEVTNEPTCTEMGTTTYTATFDAEWATTQTKDVVDVPAKNHAWSVTYNFASDGKTCTATRVCANDASHNVTANAEITSKETVAPTCTEMGTTTYTATFDVEWATTQTKAVVDVPAKDHAWSVTYNFASDGKTCTATRVCANDASHNVTANAEITSKETVAPTCTEKGTTTYTATFAETWADTQTLDVVDIAKLGHDWAETTYSFADDGSACTATRVCKNDANHVETVNATITSEVTNEPTCTEKGTTTYTATFDAEWTTTQTKDVVDVPAKDHAWSVTYNFASDGKTCTATRVCANDASHNVTANAEITSKETVAPTCTEMGTTTYTATFDVEWATTQTKAVVDVPAKDHAWSVTYNFASDGKTCTATRVCANDTDHNVTVDATITSAVKTPATCEGKGTTTYTATFAEDWADEQKLDVVDIPAKNHAWSVEYDFAEDGSACTAIRVCGNDADHNVTVDATITSAVKTPATCEGKGTTTYTATFDVDWAEPKTKDVEDIAAINHDWSVEYNFAEDGSACTATRVCANDADHNVTVNATITSAVKTPATCEGKGTTTYTATFEAEWATAQSIDVDDIAKLGHNFQNYKSNEDATCTEDGTKTGTCTRCTETDTVADTGSVLGHSFTSYVSNNDATCLEDGTKTAKCDRCEVTDTITDEGSVLGHNIVVDAAVAPTCTATGLTEGSHCSRCDDATVEQTVVDALGHKYVGVVTTEPTCTEKGVKTYTCQNDASHTYTEDIKETGHDFDKVKSEDNLTRPVLKNGVWADGYYTYTCKNNSAHTTTEAVKRADYSKFDEIKETADYILSEDIPAEDKEKLEAALAALADNLIVTEQAEVDNAAEMLKEVINEVYPDMGLSLEIRGGTTFFTGTVLDLKAFKVGGIVDIEATNVTWVSSDDSVVFFTNGRLLAIGTGTVTLTATSGILTASTTVTVVEGGDARSVSFVAMDRMHFIIEDYFLVFNSARLNWSDSHTIRFRVHLYNNYPFETCVVYANGQMIEPDADGYYTVEAGTGNVKITVAGGVVEDDGSGNGTGTRFNFWEWLLALLRKIINFFKGIFGIA